MYRFLFILFLSLVFFLNQTPHVFAQAQPLECGGGQGINSALGCIATYDMNAFINQILRWASGIVVAAAIVIIVYGGIMITTSSGDPKRVKAGQEAIYSAITAIALVALSVITLNFLGINVLGLGGFGF